MLVQWHCRLQRCSTVATRSRSSSGGSINTTSIIVPAAAERQSSRPAHPLAASRVAVSAEQQQQQQAVEARPPAAAPAADTEEEAEADTGLRVLKRLCLYVPRGRGGGVFGDGPASLGRVQPYRRKEFAAMIQHSANALPTLSLKQLAGVASALAAAQHLDVDFMKAIARQVVSRLRDARDGGEWGPICHTALAYARLGVLDAEMMSALAGSGELVRPGG